MAKRKWLIILTLTITSDFAYSGAWLLNKGEWGYYYNSEYSADISRNFNKIKRLEYKYLKDLVQIIVELKLDREKVNTSPYLTHEAKKSRFRIIDPVLASCLTALNQNTLYYMKNNNSVLIEYGVRDYLTAGVNISSGFSEKYSFSTLSRKNYRISTIENIYLNTFSYDKFENFIRVKLFKNDKYIISLQPKISIAKDYEDEQEFSTEIRLLLGKNHIIKKFNIKTFSNFEVAYKVSNLDFRETIISDFSQGVCFKNGWQILWQNIIEKRINNLPIYQETLKEKVSLAKTKSLISKNGQKVDLTLQLGYFTEISLTKKRRLSEGVFVSLWVQI